MHSNEKITVPGSGNRNWHHYYTYDMLSQLTDAVMNRSDTQYIDWDYGYQYTKAGNVLTKDVNSTSTGYTYDGDIMTKAGSTNLTWDKNGQYYLRARMYDPVLMRFTGRDPVRGKFQEPMTLHRYLYCQNEPLNRIDPSGQWGIVDAVVTGAALRAHSVNLAAYAASSGNWEFFDLAEFTYNFTPVAMAVASATIRTWAGYGTALIMGHVVETFTHATGMEFWEGIGMNYFAYLAYTGFVLNERLTLQIWPWEMEDFIEWKERTHEWY